MTIISGWIIELFYFMYTQDILLFFKNKFIIIKKLEMAFHKLKQNISKLLMKMDIKKKMW